MRISHSCILIRSIWSVKYTICVTHSSTMASSTATLKVARDYFISSQSTVLIPNRNFGSRKLVNVGINKQPKIRKPDIDPDSITEGVELSENYFHLDPGQSTVGDLDSGCYTPSDLDLNNFSSMQTGMSNNNN